MTDMDNDLQEAAQRILRAIEEHPSTETLNREMIREMSENQDTEFCRRLQGMKSVFNAVLVPGREASEDCPKTTENALRPREP